MSEKTIVRVRDVMKPEFDMVEGVDTIATILRESQHPQTKCFIVDVRDENDEYGIVLLSDIAKQVLARDKSPERVNVYEIMSKPVISVDPDMDVRYCARLFNNFGLSNAPVVENGRIIGVVSYTELVFNGLCELTED